MKIKEAIQLANEAGFGAKCNPEVYEEKCDFGWFDHIVLDPKFWESLGKKLKWDENCKYPKEWFYEHGTKKGTTVRRCSLCLNDTWERGKNKCPNNTPTYHFHRFITFLEVGATAENFFEALFSKNLAMKHTHLYSWKDSIDSTDNFN